MNNSIGPHWQLDDEYKSFSDPQFTDDLDAVEKAVNCLTALNQKRSANTDQSVVLCQQAYLEMHQASVFLMNLSTYTHCRQSTKSSDEEALVFDSKLQQLGAQLASALAPFRLYISLCSETEFEAFLSDETLKSYRFQLELRRHQAIHLLSESEETLLTEFRQHGLSAFSKQYDRISGEIKVEIPSLQKDLGLAEAAGLVFGSDALLRKEAWLGIQKSWAPHREAVATGLNSMAGWRIEECKRRSKKKNLSFMDVALQSSRIESSTLESMMSAVNSRKEITNRAMKYMAKELKKDRLDPWDLLSDRPKALNPLPLAWDESIDLVRSAFQGISKEAGEFVDIMVNNNWIEAGSGPGRKQGAYCTRFAKSRNPRVFQTFLGSTKDLFTLAHELGHAYHNWVLRDVSRPESAYPMTLAETASVLAEASLAELLSQSSNEEIQKSVAWDQAVSAVTFLANIPARFDFEHSFYTERQTGYLSPRRLDDLCNQTWQKWFGGNLTQYETQYWATKMHFSIDQVSFYNFPYTFGYLFSLGIMNEKEKQGSNFGTFYRNLLLDTGKMPVEAVVKKHLNQDLSKPDFWNQCLDMVDRQIQ